MKRFVLTLALVISAATSLRADIVTSLDQVTTWVGTGSNRAAFVADWNDGSTTHSFIWGYRWDGTKTGNDMLKALAASDTGLYAYYGSFSFGDALIGLGFDLNRNNTFGVSPSLTFTNGVATTTNSANFNDSRTATDAGDFYREGWNFGYWELSTKSSSVSPWTSSMVGLGHNLQNGEWDGVAFNASFSNSVSPTAPSNAPGVNVPVPAPASLILFVAAAPILALRRRR